MTDTDKLEALQNVAHDLSYMHKEGSITSVITNAFNTFGIKPAETVLSKGVALALASVPVAAAAVGGALAKTTSPSVLAGTTEQELIKASIETEIASMERHIANLKARKAEKSGKARKYDKFLN